MDRAHLEGEQRIYWHVLSVQLPSHVFSGDSLDASINFSEEIV
jgi:hypothetical protein